MRFRFIGQYTGGRTSISVGGVHGVGAVVFKGNEPADVEDKDLIERLGKNPEFEAVDDAEDRGMTAAQIREALDEAGVDYPPRASKGELQKLLDGAEG